MTATENIKEQSRGCFHRGTSETLPAYDAYLKVCDNYDEYFDAEKSANGEFVTLHRSSFLCPCCNRFFKLVAEDTEAEEYEDFEELKRNSGDFFEWVMPVDNATLYTEAKYMFHDSLEENYTKCSLCGHGAFITYEKSQKPYVSVCGDINKTIVSQTLTSSHLSVLSNNDMWINRRFPVFLEIIFDHETGRTHFVLSEHRKDSVSTDITEMDDLLKGCVIKTCIDEDVDIKKNLLELFRERIDVHISFNEHEVSLETLILLNRFRGFPAPFYNALPLETNSCKIHVGFSDIAEQLRDYNSIDALYRKLNLPDKKQIRKTVFENPELIFYAKEIVGMPFENIDVILQILRSENAFRFLAELHSSPHIKKFIEYIISKRGEAAAWKTLNSGIGDLLSAASNYMLVSDKVRDELTNGSINEIAQRLYNELNVSYNIPLVRNKKGIPDCEIGGYCFEKFKNVRQYQFWAKQLNNCLDDYWQRNADSVVFGVKQKMEYVAAVELYKGEVYQVRLKNNKRADSDAEFYHAFQKWTSAYQLKQYMSG